MEVARLRKFVQLVQRYTVLQEQFNTVRQRRQYFHSVYWK